MRLKRLEKEKNSQHTPRIELTEPPKGASVSFGGTVPGANENIFSDDEDQMRVGGSVTLHMVGIGAGWAG